MSSHDCDRLYRRKWDSNPRRICNRIYLEAGRNNEEDKTWLLEYMWDVFTGNQKFKKELEELKEARFDDVCSVKECDEQGNVIPYNGEYEPEGR